MGHLDEATLEHVRRLEKFEYDHIKSYKPKHFPCGKLAALFLIETGMRRGEFYKMKTRNADWEDCVNELEGQKTDRSKKRVKKWRLVPPTARAIAILRLAMYLKRKPRLDYGEYIWPRTDPRSCSRAIKKFAKSRELKV